MQPSDSTRFSALFADVMAYYRQDISDFMQSLFWQACQSFDFEQVQEAFSRHAKDPERGQYPPKVADLVRILQGTPTDRAMLAWGRALDAISRVGGYTDVVFDDPAIHACIEDLGGWPKFCRTDLKDLGYLQHRFCQAYTAYTGRGEFPFPRLLPGDRSPDFEFERRGLPLPRPALIGNAERCKAVYQAGVGGGKAPIAYLPVAALACDRLLAAGNASSYRAPQVAA